jgi:hypothetical protein
VRNNIGASQKNEKYQLYADFGHSSLSIPQLNLKKISSGGQSGYRPFSLNLQAIM